MKLLGFKLADHQEQIIKLLELLLSQEDLNKKTYSKLIKKFTKPDGRLYSKDEVIFSYKLLAGSNSIPDYDESFINKIKMKPVRTISGVTPVTVLTKPFPCPGKCIFCPSDIRMPKSYLSDEPGAQRAERNWFDPYLQVYNRLQALKNIGHKVDKVELIVLGGTWSYYPETYQIWFIKECFRALNEFGFKDDREEILQRYKQISSKLTLSDSPEANDKKLGGKQIKGEDNRTYNKVIDENYLEPEKELGLDKVQSATWKQLEDQQFINETAGTRSVGLVIETRPDHISEKEVIRVRRLGCTKTQIGVQSLSDEVLKKNKRGHNVAATRKAFRLLRLAGFKIHAHMMANLYGSTPENDIADFKALFTDPDFKPDELKLYPCSLIGSAELMQYYHKGLWKPYSYEELLHVISSSISLTPEYCRLTRVIRDIPSPDIVVGNKLTNFRQIAEDKLKKLGEISKDIRAREIRGEEFTKEEIKFKMTDYQTSVSQEKFLQYIVHKNGQEKILGFLRLSLPITEQFIDELKESAMIREIHVYGAVVNIGERTKGEVQHLGLGTKLIKKAKQLSKEAGYKKLNVISAIGTKEYYRKKGFTDGDLYQYLDL
ncbi:MAG: tRNA uridine(34) 5-carboxymethylaminomethyl modification radical SAM/GNAT enzyme Elp3 [Candidatus Pacebacteria bacterium]|nr:tRNA uridine(34) 5-carboxymethylaminomethyl modification radical SAM/GNAT enzyme Elp3 [Candidatus Paceibacterota bacterium]